jgi:hypothetical protein
MRKLLLIPLLALAACGESPEERNRRQDAACQSWGAKHGSPEYIQCRATLALNEDRRKDEAVTQALVAANIGVSAGGLGRR